MVRRKENGCHSLRRSTYFITVMSLVNSHMIDLGLASTSPIGPWQRGTCGFLASDYLPALCIKYPTEILRTIDRDLAFFFRANLSGCCLSFLEHLVVKASAQRITSPGQGNRWIVLKRSSFKASPRPVAIWPVQPAKSQVISQFTGDFSLKSSIEGGSVCPINLPIDAPHLRG